MRRAPTERSVAQQAFALSARHPGARVGLHTGALSCTLKLTPSKISRTYAVRIEYRLGQHPRVLVLSPELDGRLGESLPHVFSGDALCLCRDGEWSGRMLIADTIVPWASEWLFFYELWIPDGQWHGGGEWPPPRSVGSPDPPGSPGGGKAG